MAKSKKIIAIILALVMSFSIILVPVAAAGTNVLAVGGGSIENFFNMILDKLIQWLLSFFNKFWPGYDGDWTQAEDYEAQNFFAGEEKFDTEVKEAADWKLGYAQASLVKNLDIQNGEFFLAGSLEPIAGRAPATVLDDQKVRVYALTDGVSGTFVQAVIDGFGLSRGNVQVIRERLKGFAEANNIIGINVSVLHQHSCIDTLGMNVPLVPAVILNTSLAALEAEDADEYMVKKNPEFMENLFSQTVASIRKAVRDMKSGTLSYGNIDINEYIHDKREPIVFDGNLNRLRFVPDDGSKETWIVNAGIHCVGNGAGGDVLTGDYPFYMEKYINNNCNANFVFVQGAELAITSDYKPLNLPEEMERTEELQAYGEALGEKASLIRNDVKLDPVLNVKMSEVWLDVDNQILTLACREGILDAVTVKNGDEAKMVTEIGYLELGNKVGIFLAPGEFDPVIFFGGATTAEQSWMGTTWDYAPLKDSSKMETILVFGLCNDQAGYVLTDNEYHSLLTENEEVNVVSNTSGSTFTKAFAALLADCYAE